jgi:acid stress-induced BolA-like protein IbaG/YrbA
MTASELEVLIKAGIPDADVMVRGEGDHFEAEVISERFQDCSLVARHQLVYGTLGERMGAEIHALALHTYTPDEWAKKRRIQ